MKKMLHDNLSGKEGCKLKARPRYGSCVHKGNQIRLQGTYSAVPLNVTQNFHPATSNVHGIYRLCATTKHSTKPPPPSDPTVEAEPFIFFACTLMSKWIHLLSCSYLFPFMSFGQKLVEERKWKKVHYLLA